MTLRPSQHSSCTFPLSATYHQSTLFPLGFKQPTAAKETPKSAKRMSNAARAIKKWLLMRNLVNMKRNFIV